MDEVEVPGATGQFRSSPVNEAGRLVALKITTNTVIRPRPSTTGVEGCAMAVPDHRTRMHSADSPRCV